jgi:hypothetical protein
MKPITREMIKIYGIKDFDFMGYDIKNKQNLSFHHLIVAHRDCKRLHVPHDGYTLRNGAILVQNTSHDYLHLIEKIDPEIFYFLTSEMIDMNLKGKLDIENLRQIRDLLLYFENEHDRKRDKHGKLLIKREYTHNRFNWE